MQTVMVCAIPLKSSVVKTCRRATLTPAATDPGQCNFATPNFDCDGNSLRPLFTSFPANVTVQGWQVPDVSEAIVEAIVSPFAPTFEATYNNNFCYDDAPVPTIVFDGEVKIDGVCEHDYTLVPFLDGHGLFGLQSYARANHHCRRHGRA